jgi:tRNA(fMet)-specific endonuclease VapC
MIRYLLDANAVSYIIRKASPHLSLRFESSHIATSAISVVTEAELLSGLARRPEAHALATSVHNLLGKIAIVPWSSNSARLYAEIRADLERRGQRMDDMDIMIAAEALAQNAILVTADVAFRRIDRLKVEAWTAF